MKSVLTIALAGLLILLGLALAWLNIQDNRPASNAEQPARDLFGQPVNETGNTIPRPGFPPPLPPRLDSKQRPESAMDKPLNPAQDMFIGPRQPFEPPEIIAYA